MSLLSAFVCAIAAGATLVLVVPWLWAHPAIGVFIVLAAIFLVVYRRRAKGGH